MEEKRFAPDASAEPGHGSELGLMKRVAAGDPHAQRVLAHRLAARVRRISQRLLGSSADGDDAAQVALMEILKSAGGYREESSVERWADRIAVRVTLHHARAQRRLPWSRSAGIEPDEVGIAGDEPRARDETPRALEAYLAELPAARREALTLKHALGHTTEEVAELTGVSVGTVKDRLVAARKQLRKLIQRDARIGTRRKGREHA